MTKKSFQSVYHQLRPEIRKALNQSAREYDSAKRLKYTLMSERLWSYLTLSTISEICTYADVYTYQTTGYDIMYGDRFLQKDKS